MPKPEPAAAEAESGPASPAETAAMLPATERVCRGVARDAESGQETVVAVLGVDVEDHVLERDCWHHLPRIPDLR